MFAKLCLTSNVETWKGVVLASDDLHGVILFICRRKEKPCLKHHCHFIVQCQA